MHSTPGAARPLRRQPGAAPPSPPPACDSDYLDFDPVHIRGFFDSAALLPRQPGARAAPLPCAAGVDPRLIAGARTPPSAFRLARAEYKPRLVRGAGPEREGLCERCNKWYRLKTSSYWYHMNFTHGISSKGRAYPVPAIQETADGLCTVCPRCKKSVAVGGRKNKEMTLFSWYRHYQRGCLGPDLA